LFPLQEKIVKSKKKINFQTYIKKMMKTSNRKLKCLNVGTTVLLPIPDVDKARGSPRHLLAVVTDVQDDLYKLCSD